MKTLRILALLAAVGLAGCGGSSPAANTSGSSGSSAPSASSGATSGSSGPGTQSTSPPSTTATQTTTTSTSASGGASPTARACTAAQFALSFLGSQGAAGHGVLGFALRNTSGASCHTFGYPGIQFLSAGGQGLTTKPSHVTVDLMGTTRLERLTVAPGGLVSFRLAVSHVASSAAACTTVAALAVIPPDDTQALRVSIPSGADECDGTVTVSPLEAGTSAYPSGGQ